MLYDWVSTLWNKIVPRFIYDLAHDFFGGVFTVRSRKIPRRRMGTGTNFPRQTGPKYVYRTRPCPLTKLNYFIPNRKN